MSHSFVLTAPAAEDLDGILYYVLEKGGPQQAQHVLEHFQEAFQKIAGCPGIGHKREDLTSLPVLF